MTVGNGRPPRSSKRQDRLGNARSRSRSRSRSRGMGVNCDSGRSVDSERGGLTAQLPTYRSHPRGGGGAKAASLPFSDVAHIGPECLEYALHLRPLSSDADQHRRSGGAGRRSSRPSKGTCRNPNCLALDTKLETIGLDDAEFASRMRRKEFEIATAETEVEARKEHEEHLRAVTQTLDAEISTALQRFRQLSDEKKELEDNNAQLKESIGHAEAELQTLERRLRAMELNLAMLPPCELVFSKKPSKPAAKSPRAMATQGPWNQLEPCLRASTPAYKQNSASQDEHDRRDPRKPKSHHSSSKAGGISNFARPTSSSTSRCKSHPPYSTSDKPARHRPPGAPVSISKRQHQHHPRQRKDSSTGMAAKMTVKARTGR